MKLVKDTENLQNKNQQVSDAKAEEAVKTIIQWIGENPNREGLKSTPKRVIKAFREYFGGYTQDPKNFYQKLSQKLKVMTIWLLKKILVYKATVNIIWRQLLEWLMLHIFHPVKLWD